MRSRRTPVEIWEARVFYDAWGSPFVRGRIFGGSASYSTQALLPNGRTSDNIYGVEWKHLSGPEITWPVKPERWSAHDKGEPK